MERLNFEVEFRFFLLLAAVRSSTSFDDFVLKLHGRYVPGLESVQAFILQ